MFSLLWWHDSCLPGSQHQMLKIVIGTSKHQTHLKNERDSYYLHCFLERANQTEYNIYKVNYKIIALKILLSLLYLLNYYSDCASHHGAHLYICLFVCFSHFLPLKRIGGLESTHWSGNGVNEQRLTKKTLLTSEEYLRDPTEALEQ